MSSPIGGCPCAQGSKSHDSGKVCASKSCERKHESIKLETERCTCQHEEVITCCNDCNITPCEEYSAQEISCMLGDAVVTVMAKYILVGLLPAPLSGPLVTDLTLPAPGAYAMVIRIGNGTRLADGTILTPWSLVVAPPSLSSALKVYPFVKGETAARVVGLQGKMTATYGVASNIQAVVNNVNGSGCTYIYDATLMGGDGTSNQAYLNIKHNCGINCLSPKIGACHPHIPWGDSREAGRNGQNVYLIGDPITNPYDPHSQHSSSAIVRGIIADHRYVDYSGRMLAEGILVSAPVYQSMGMAIVSAQGKLLGMQTSSLSGYAPAVSPSSLINFPYLTQTTGQGRVAGPSSYFLRPVAAAIIQSYRDCYRDECRVRRVDLGRGSIGIYRKGYLGVATRVATAASFTTVTDYRSGAAPYGQFRFRLNARGDFERTYATKVVGAQVLGVGGANPNGAPNTPNGRFYVPGGKPLADSPFPEVEESPLLNRVDPGDVIVSITPMRVNKDGKRAVLALGDLKNQVALSLITYASYPGDILDLCVIKGGQASINDYTSRNGYMTEMSSVEVSLGEYPDFLNWPYDAIDTWPQLLTNQSPAVAPDTFTANELQLTSPQVPQLNLPGSGIFVQPL